MTNFKKGDIVAIVETRVTHYVHGSRPAETSYTIKIVQVASATRDGAAIKSYRAYPSSPIYKYENRYNQFKLMAIGGDPQANARRLFDAATYFLEFDTQEAAISAILAA